MNERPKLHGEEYIGCNYPFIRIVQQNENVSTDSPCDVLIIHTMNSIFSILMGGV